MGAMGFTGKAIAPMGRSYKITALPGSHCGSDGSRDAFAVNATYTSRYDPRRSIRRHV